MKRLIATAAVAAVLLFPAPAWAQSAAGASQECGTYTWHEDLTKGRTDGIVVHVKHTAGCFTYDYTNLSPAGNGEAQGNPWQMRNCIADGRTSTVGHFKYYRGVSINPEDVTVTCTRYQGPD